MHFYTPKMTYQKGKLFDIFTIVSNKKNPRNKFNQGGIWKIIKHWRESTNKSKHILCSQIRKINIVKMSILPKAMYRFITILSNPSGVLHRTKTNTPTIPFIWNHKRPQRAIAILRKKNRVVDIMLPDIKLCYKVILFKTSWYWHKNRHIDQWNRIKSPGQFLSHEHFLG